MRTVCLAVLTAILAGAPRAARADAAPAQPAAEPDAAQPAAEPDAAQDAAPDAAQDAAAPGEQGGHSTGGGAPRAPGRRSAGSAAAASLLDEARGHVIRLGVWLASLSLLGCGIVVAYRRRRAAAGGASPGRGLQVLSRAHLSPRHQVVLLEVEGRRLLLGVHGDGMTRLLDWSAAQAVVPAPGEGGASAASSRGAGPPPGRGAASVISPVEEADLVPYRAQMEKLRSLLHGGKKGSEGGYYLKEYPESVERGGDLR